MISSHEVLSHMNMPSIQKQCYPHIYGFGMNECELKIMIIERVPLMNFTLVFQNTFTSEDAFVVFHLK
uniref:Uncharacterized protein n=1 Tax=Kalanchoe fedtschenkoi TaxID=63787 RepID=A0A7N0TIQ8_KALFE